MKARYTPEEIEREFLSERLPAAEARRIVNEAIDARDRELRARAGRSMKAGIAIFVLAGGLSAATLVSWNAGGYAVLFYGGVLAGLAEFGRGWCARPARPRHLGDPPIASKSTARRDDGPWS